MNRKISIYSILEAINIVIFFAMIYVYSVCGDNHYINEGTIWINAIQCVLSHFVLRDAGRNSNSLLAVLAFVMIIHFELRIVSLNWTEFSVIIQERVKINANGINWILCYVVASYFLTWIGLRYYQRKNDSQQGIGEIFEGKATRNVLVLLYISFLLMFMSAIGIPGISHFVGVLSVYFLNMNFLMLFGIGYFLFRWKDISHREKLWFIMFLVIYIAVFTGIGRRSTIYGIVLVTFFALLAFNRVYVKIKFVVLGVALLPLMVWMFSFSTFTRQNRQQTLNFDDAVELSRNLSEQTDWSDTRMVLAPVFNRIAFFDFTVEMVQNSDHLKNYLTPENYIKSVVDNLFTPGFDIFDMPKMSYVITKSYIVLGSPSSKRYNIDDNFQSDATSWYGEAYLLFGKYLALPIIFIVSILIRNYYQTLIRRKTLSNIWKQSIVLYLFYTLLYSYGLDWWLIYLVSFVINFLIFRALTIEKRSFKIQKNNSL